MTMDRGFGTVDVQGPWRQKLLSPLPWPMLVTNVFGLTASMFISQPGNYEKALLGPSFPLDN